MLFEQLS